MVDLDIQRVADLHKAGRSHAEIQEATGFGYTKVARSVFLARRAGILPPRALKAPPRQRVKDRFASRNVKLGYMSDVLLALTLEQQDWLTIEVAKDYASVAEYLVELVRDEHAKATVKNNPER